MSRTLAVGEKRPPPTSEPTTASGSSTRPRIQPIDALGPYGNDYLPDGIQKRTIPAQVDQQPRIAWIPLNGAYSGDIWHCMAAEILWEYQRSQAPATSSSQSQPQPPATAPLFSTWRPKMAVVCWNYSEELYKEKYVDKKKVEEPVNIDRGRSSWEYARFIGLTPVGVTVKKPSGTLGANESHLVLEYVTRAAMQQRFEAQRALPPEETSFNAVIGKDKPIMLTEENEVGGPSRDDHIIQLHASTSIVMQLMDNLGVSNAQKILGHRLSLGIEDRHVQGANARLKKLVETILLVKNEQNVHSVLLFAYRKGDLNKQHDSNSELLNQVIRLAKESGIGVIIIPQMWPKYFASEVPDFKIANPAETVLDPNEGTGGDPNEYQYFEEDEDPAQIIDIEGDDPPPQDVATDLTSPTPQADAGKGKGKAAAVPAAVPAPATAPPKRYYFDLFGDCEKIRLGGGKPMQAYIWSLIARTLQLESPVADGRIPSWMPLEARCLVGLIGGRSGSMDLPSFVGVNCLSWDEPLFTADYNQKKGINNYHPSYFNHEGPQTMRLLNQASITRVCYLDSRSRNMRDASPRQTYKRLTEDSLLLDFLNTRGARPQGNDMCKLVPATADIPNSLKLIDAYQPLTEKPALGVQAINLRCIRKWLSDRQGQSSQPSTKPTGSKK